MIIKFLVFIVPPNIALYKIMSLSLLNMSVLINYMLFIKRVDFN